MTRGSRSPPPPGANRASPPGPGAGHSGHPPPGPGSGHSSHPPPGPGSERSSQPPPSNEQTVGAQQEPELDHEQRLTESPPPDLVPVATGKNSTKSDPNLVKDEDVAKSNITHGFNSVSEMKMWQNGFEPSPRGLRPRPPLRHSLGTEPQTGGPGASAWIRNPTETGPQFNAPPQGGQGLVGPQPPEARGGTRPRENQQRQRPQGQVSPPYFETQAGYFTTNNQAGRDHTAPARQSQPVTYLPHAPAGNLDPSLQVGQGVQGAGGPAPRQQIGQQQQQGLGMQGALHQSLQRGGLSPGSQLPGYQGFGQIASPSVSSAGPPTKKPKGKNKIGKVANRYFGVNPGQCPPNKHREANELWNTVRERMQGVVYFLHESARPGFDTAIGQQQLVQEHDALLQLAEKLQPNRQHVGDLLIDELQDQAKALAAFCLGLAKKLAGQPLSEDELDSVNWSFDRLTYYNLRSHKLFLELRQYIRAFTIHDTESSGECASSVSIPSFVSQESLKSAGSNTELLHHAEEKARQILAKCRNMSVEQIEAELSNLSASQPHKSIELESVRISVINGLRSRVEILRTIRANEEQEDRTQLRSVLNIKPEDGKESPQTEHQRNQLQASNTPLPKSPLSINSSASSDFSGFMPAASVAPPGGQSGPGTLSGPAVAGAQAEPRQGGGGDPPAGVPPPADTLPAGSATRPDHPTPSRVSEAGQAAATQAPGPAGPGKIITYSWL